MEPHADTRAILTQAYAAFNRRDIDAALVLMAERVDWPAASEGGRVVGKAAIRAYWTRQWADFDPHVEPLAITARPDGTAEVTVHQLVRNRNGDILSDQVVLHTYTLTNGLIDRMDVVATEPAFGDK